MKKCTCCGVARFCADCTLCELLMRMDRASVISLYFYVSCVLCSLFGASLLYGGAGSLSELCVGFITEVAAFVFVVIGVSFRLRFFALMRRALDKPAA